MDEDRTLRTARTLPYSPKAVYELGWDARDSRGNPVAAGVYFVRLVSGAAALERRVTLMP